MSAEPDASAPRWTVDENGRAWWGPDDNGYYADLAGWLIAASDQPHDALVECVRKAEHHDQLESRLALAEAAERMIQRSGLRVAWCMYCGLPCLCGEKRSFCCGEATTNTDPSAEVDAITRARQGQD